MKIVVMKLAGMKPAPYNPRRRLQKGDMAYSHIEKSIAEFGYVQPIVWNERTNNIVAGEQRHTVLLDMGIEEEAVCIVDLDDAQEKALNIALNKITGEWDHEKLCELLEELADIENIDLNAIGFCEKEFEALTQHADLAVQNLVNKEIDPADYGEDQFNHVCPRCGFAFE